MTEKNRQNIKPINTVKDQDSYEYKVVMLQVRLMKNELVEWEQALNEHGQDGWELVSVIPMNAHIGGVGSTKQARCFMKRKK